MARKIQLSRMQKIKRDFIAGVAIIFPVAVTIYITIIIFKVADGILGRFVNKQIFAHFGYKIPGIGIVLGVLFILLTGMLANRFIGIKLFPFLESIIIKLPLLRHVYAPAKQLSSFLFKGGKGSAFNRVVLVPYPKDDTYSIGFMTNDELIELDSKIGRRVVAVLVSTPPSPFSGPLIFVPKEKVITLDLSMEEAIKFIVSGGLAAPQRYLAAKTEPKGGGA